MKVCVLSAILLGTLMSIGAPSSAYAATSSCEASWYGPGFHGKKMANGRTFNQNDASTVAHKSLAFGTRLKVTNTRNGKTLEVVVRDRGPYIAGRCLDFSQAAAVRLGFKDRGHTVVKYTVVN